MKMILRWFPFGDDSVSLEHIRQVPGISGVATCLSDVPVGEVWPLDRLKALKDEVNKHGLEMEVIESVNIHEDIKKGFSSRDKYIDAYVQTIRNLAKVGIKCLCYNFMPVLDWVRTDLAHVLPDGSETMAYRHAQISTMDPNLVARSMRNQANGFSLPGWEPERLSSMAADIEFYRHLSEDEYWGNMKYFLDAVIPEAEACDIKMAIHPDDPPWSIFGLPRVITDAAHIRTFLSLNDSPYNGITLCTGSLGSDRNNDIPAIVREFAGKGRVPFAHIRNVKHLGRKDFNETAHLSQCGDLDMYEIVKAFHDSGFDGYIRPDHGRMIWGEQGRPGYGLFDRAIGANYLLGLWEAIEKSKKEANRGKA